MSTREIGRCMPGTALPDVARCPIMSGCELLLGFARHNAANAPSVLSGIPPVARDEVDVDVHDVLPRGTPDIDADVVAVGVAVAIGERSTVVDEPGKGHPLFIGRIEVALDVPERDDEQVAGAHRMDVVAGVTEIVSKDDILRPGVTERAWHEPCSRPIPHEGFGCSPSSEQAGKEPSREAAGEGDGVFGADLVAAVAPYAPREIDLCPPPGDGDRMHRADPLALPTPDARRVDHAGPGGISPPEPPNDGEDDPPPGTYPAAGVGRGFLEIRDREFRRIVADRPDGRGIEEPAPGRASCALDLERVHADEPCEDAIHGRVIAPGEDDPDRTRAPRLGAVSLHPNNRIHDLEPGLHALVEVDNHLPEGPLVLEPEVVDRFFKPRDEPEEVFCRAGHPHPHVGLCLRDDHDRIGLHGGGDDGELFHHLAFRERHDLRTGIVVQGGAGLLGHCDKPAARIRPPQVCLVVDDPGTRAVADDDPAPVLHKNPCDGGNDRRMGGDAPFRLLPLKEVRFEEDALPRCEELPDAAEEVDRAADGYIDLFRRVIVASDDRNGCIPAGRLHLTLSRDVRAPLLPQASPRPVSSLPGLLRAEPLRRSPGRPISGSSRVRSCRRHT